MLEAFVYIFFFWALVAESVIFLLLNIPTPKGIKGKIVSFLVKNQIVAYVMYAHLGFCALALFFYIDLTNSQSHFMVQKQKLRHSVDRHIGTELRIGFLSYTILKIQRNKYITFMLIYVSIALTLFILLLRKMYKKRQNLESLGLLDKIQRKQSEKLHPHNVPDRSSEGQSSTNRDSATRDSINRQFAKTKIN